jgi:hypothetical protein
VNLLRREPVSEAVTKPTIAPPQRDRAARAGRQGFVTGIPIGGSTPTNPGTQGELNRQDQMDQLKMAYLSCIWVSSCADVIAKTCTAGGIQVVPNSRPIEGQLATPKAPPGVVAIQKLLEWINPYDDSRQLFRSIITDLLIYGDSFTEVTYMLGKPLALWSLSPETMTVIANEHGIVTGYSQQMESGQSVTFKVTQVIHVKMDAPGNGGLYGVSPTQKNLLPITAWLYTMALVKTTMKKGDPLRAHVDWNLALPEAEMRRFQQQYAVRNLGAKNIGNLFETKGGTQVKELGTNQVNNWLNILQQRRDETISGFGVPPSKVGVIEAGNIGGGQGTSQDKSFRVNTCGPLQELVLEKFTSRLLWQCYGVEDWHLEFGEVDWRDDETIETIRDMRIRNGLWVLNRGRRDIGEPPVPGGDDAVLVDRQNMTMWSDIGALSKANVDAVKAQATTGGKGSQTTPPQPSPKPGQGTESTDDPGGVHERRAALFPKYRTAAEEYAELEIAFEQSRAARRAAILKEI